MSLKPEGLLPTFNIQALESHGWTKEGLTSFVFSALDHLDQGITVIDGDLRLVMWNRQLTDLLGFPESLIYMGMPLEELIRFNARRGEYGEGIVEDHVRHRMNLARQFRSHCFERSRPNGRIIEVKGNPLDSGGFVTVYTDITERRQNEIALEEGRTLLESRVRERTHSLHNSNRELREEMQAHQQTLKQLEENEHWLRTITDNLPALIAYVDADLYLRFVNARIYDWFGIDQSTATKMNCLNATAPHFIRSLTPKIQDSLTGEVGAIELEFDHLMKQKRTAAVTMIPHLSADGSTSGVFLVAQDITEYKTAQDALLQSSKLNAIGRLTGAIAHDFSNLLTIIQGNLAFIQQISASNENEFSDALNSCQKTATRGADLTRRLLAFARHESLQPQPIEVVSMLQDLRILLTAPLGDRIDIEVECIGEVGCIAVDPFQLENALLNLIFNARDAISHHGEVLLRASKSNLDRKKAHSLALSEGQYIVLSVCDNGCGIPEEALGQVMEPFFTTKDVESGTGLGLSTVYGFVRQSGGDMTIKSKLNMGTTVDLYLPACKDGEN